MKMRVALGAVSAALFSVLIFVSVKKVFWHEQTRVALETKIDVPETTEIVPIRNTGTQSSCVYYGW